MSAILDIRKPKFRRDWSAYLVIADQYDDAGDEVTARRLRREGEMMRTLIEALTPACERSPYKTLVLKGELPCGCFYQAWVAKKQVTLTVWGPVRGKIPLKRNGITVLVDDRPSIMRLHMDRQIIACPQRSEYLPERIREIFINTAYLFESSPCPPTPSAAPFTLPGSQTACAWSCCRGTPSPA